MQTLDLSAPPQNHTYTVSLYLEEKRWAMSSIMAISGGLVGYLIHSDRTL